MSAYPKNIFLEPCFILVDYVASHWVDGFVSEIGSNVC